MTKAELRSELRNIREAVTDRRNKSEVIISTLLNTKFYNLSKSILSYWNTLEEVSTQGLLEQALSDGKAVFIPFMEELKMGQIESMNAVGLNIEYKIPEPLDYAKDIDYQNLDLIIVPGLGFDPKGVRLGNGGGWFDRFLKGVNEYAVRIGLAFDDQVVTELPSEPTDEKVDIVITEKRFIICSRHAA